MTSYLYRAPAGIPGEVTRPDETTVEPGILSIDFTPAAYGLALKTTGGGSTTFQTMGAAGTADTAIYFYGVLSRIAPSVSSNVAGSNTYAGAGPNVASTQGVVTRGYVNVLCPTGTPIRGSNVYVVVVAYANQPIGSFSAAINGTNTVLLPNVIWASDGKDAQNNAEIRIAR